MNTILIFIWIYAAMVAMSFWEAYVEGRHPWNRRKLGWRIYFTKRYCLPAYHFYVFVVMWPLLLTLPLVIFGWDLKLFGILFSAYFSGIVIEDFMWFVVNPAVKLSDFNPKFANFYPWLKIGKFQIPVFYIVFIFISIFIWYFIWR